MPLCTVFGSLFGNSKVKMAGISTVKNLDNYNAFKKPSLEKKKQNLLSNPWVKGALWTATAATIVGIAYVLFRNMSPPYENCYRYEKAGELTKALECYQHISDFDATDVLKTCQQYRNNDELVKAFNCFEQLSKQGEREASFALYVANRPLKLSEDLSSTSRLGQMPDALLSRYFWCKSTRLC